MFELVYPSSFVADALKTPPTTIAWLADRLPVTRHGRPGKKRRYSMKDICVLYLATYFGQRGMLPAAAIDMASEAEKYFVQIAVDEHEEGAKYYLLTPLKPDAMGRFRPIITKDPQVIFDHFDDGVAIFNLTELLKDGMLISIAYAKSRATDHE